MSQVVTLSYKFKSVGPSPSKLTAHKPQEALSLPNQLQLKTELNNIFLSNNTKIILKRGVIRAECRYSGGISTFQQDGASQSLLNGDLLVRRQ